ncbi:MAG: hypothetical protein HY342_09450 [Candidatus Lambdaproteobacteria bacterium]|nr:hypothetical protein [Candidatus Lambdaproteobacteria bacterium]
MNPITDMLRFTRSTSKAVEKALMALEQSRATVRVEIEKTRIRFNTVLSVRKSAVVVAKPEGLGRSLQVGSTIRFTLPDESGRNLRLEVSTPNFNLSNGSSVFLCKMPKKFAEGAVRMAVRFDTTRFNNLLLTVKDKGGEGFRILDLSSGGCKFQCPGTPTLKSFPVGKKVLGGAIQLGDRVNVELEHFIPRAHMGSAVGCEFKISLEGPNAKYLQHLLISLEKSERERFKPVAM